MRPHVREQPVASRLGLSYLTTAGSAEDDSSWLITMSDLMSLLLIFFLVWTTVQLAQRVNGPVGTPRVQENAVDPVSELQNIILEVAPAEIRDGTVVVVLEEKLSFPLGADRLTAQGQQILQRIAPLLRRQAAAYEIDVLGHTDDLPVHGGSWASNLDLSLARATTVWKYLVDLGMSPQRMKLQGLGPWYPALPNTSLESRAYNRRVELVLRPVAGKGLRMEGPSMPR